MLDERSILKDHDGYKIVPGSFEAAINVSLEREIAVENLPRVHDVQLMFRREDVLKVTAKNNDLAVTLRRLATQIEYSNEDRPPASKKSDKPFIDGYKRTGCLYPSPLADPAAPGQAHTAGGSVGIDLIDRIFNPLDPLSIIQLFYKPERAGRRALADSASTPGRRGKLHPATSSYFYWSSPHHILLGDADGRGGIVLCARSAGSRSSNWPTAGHPDFIFVHMVRRDGLRVKRARQRLTCAGRPSRSTVPMRYALLMADQDRHGSATGRQQSIRQRPADAGQRGPRGASPSQRLTYVNIKETRKLHMISLSPDSPGTTGDCQCLLLESTRSSQLGEDQMAQLLKAPT